MIGSRLTELRESKGVTIEELAKKLNVTADEVYAWEKGEKEVDAMTENSIALALDVPVIDLSTEENQEEIQKNKKGYRGLVFGITLLLIYLLGWLLFNNAGHWLSEILS